MDRPALACDPRAPGGADRAGSFAEYEQTTVGDWAVRGYGTVSSTQDIAAGLPAWTAVVAECQTAGRGQWDRSFTSDRGGLYLTAVLPFDGQASRWRQSLRHCPSCTTFCCLTPAELACWGWAPRRG